MYSVSATLSSCRAWLLLPGVYFHAWGKLMFCGLDIVVGWCIHGILRIRGVSSAASSVFAAVFLLHPFVINVSTRGNGDSAVCALVLATIWSLLSHHETLGAALLGLAVHVKIYPIIYVPTLLAFLDEHYVGGRTASIASSRAQRGQKGRRRLAGSDNRIGPRCWDRVQQQLTRAVIVQRLRFAVVSLVAFTGATAVSYVAYGEPMLSEAFMYHLTRADARHSFSAHFYPAYLATSDVGEPLVVDTRSEAQTYDGISLGSPSIDRALASSSNADMAGVVDAELSSARGGDGDGAGHRVNQAFETGRQDLGTVSGLRRARELITRAPIIANSVAQWGSVLFLGLYFARDLPAAMFFQTWAFVAWNRVITAQYFHWYNCLLPLVLVQSRLRTRPAVVLGITWLLSEVSQLSHGDIIKLLSRWPQRGTLVRTLLMYSALRLPSYCGTCQLITWNSEDRQYFLPSGPWVRERTTLTIIRKM